MSLCKNFDEGGLNYDLYEHRLHDSKTDLGIYKRGEQAEEYIYVLIILPFLAEQLTLLFLDHNYSVHKWIN